YRLYRVYRTMSKIKKDAPRLKVGEVAERLGVGMDRVLQLIINKDIKAWRFGPKTIRICPESVESYITSCQLEPNDNEEHNPQESTSSQFNRLTKKRGNQPCKVTR
ncbi:unnamed protein product, partial [marine sediment metagenome]